MSKLKLGWYRCAFGLPILYEVRCVADDVDIPTVAYIADGRMQVGTVVYFKECFEFVSVEEPETWVPADPSKITLEMLPMRARFRDHEEQSWDEGILVGFRKGQFLDGDENPCPYEYWKLCEVIHCEVVQ